MRRYSVTVDGKEVPSFTVAHPVINVCSLSTTSTARGRGLLDHNLALRLGLRLLQSAAPRCRAAGGDFRFNYNDVAYSKAFHLPVRK